MSNGGLPSRSPRAGRSNGFFPTSIRAILRGASSLASTVRSAGTSVASSISSASDDRQREQVQWAGFDTLELGPGRYQRVLLLTYVNGFQVWNVEDANDVWELVSKRDGPVALLRVQPQPISDAAFDAARPLLLVVTSDTTVCRSSGVHSRPGNGYSGVAGSPPSFGENHFVPTLVKFYSFQNHTYVHTLKFRSAIYSVRCSIRIVAVATAAQIYCFDAATLENTFSVITYPSPSPGVNGLNIGYGPMAVGSRWLAYAPNQPLLSNTGRVSPQHLSPSPGVSPSTSPANGSLVAYYAKESGKQFAAGIVTLGDLGYKAFSKYCTDGLSSPEPGSPLQRSNCNLHAEHAGTVHVRDFVSKVLVAQFRAHDSPLSALCFDHTGTLLVTASIHGHNINVFRVMPGLSTNGSSYDVTASHAHLYKLSRGVTNAIIQDITFSEDSHWIVVSSSRGTNHLFCISPYGGMVGPLAHSVDMALGAVSPMRVLPWWCSLGPVKSTQQASSPPPPTVSSSVVSRIKNGNAGWRGTVSGAAAAASGRSSSSVGAVAVLFHDGRGHKLDAEANQASLKEQLWALSASGHLIRYAIHLSAVTEGFHDGITPAENAKDAVDVRVLVEPLEKWDVSRKPNHLEREEKIINPNPHDVMHDIVGSSGGTSLALCVESGKEEPIPDEMHRLFLSKAEVQMHHFRPPLWVKSQISFHVFGGLGHTMVGGEIEFEKVSTRVVEVRKKDLVPVYDRLKNYQFGDDVRDMNNPWGGTLNSSSSYSGTTYGFIRPDTGGIPIQRSSSGSSCGSEGSLCSGPLQNGIHHAYQEVFAYHQPLPDSKQRPERSKSQETDFSGIGSVEDKICAISVSTVGSPLYVFPYSESHDGASNLQVKESSNKTDGPMVRLHSSSSDAGSISNGYLINQGGYNHINTEAPRSDSTRAEEGVCCHTSATSNVDQVSPRASHNVEGKFDLQDLDAATEDVESTDGNSKSEDLGGEQAEDGWEGGMFPFAEDC